MNQPIQQAAELIRAKQYAEARRLLTALVKQDPNDANAWFLLSFTFSERQRQLDCLQRALKINPIHPQAAALYQKLAGGAPPAPGTAEPASPPVKPAAQASPSTSTTSSWDSFRQDVSSQKGGRSPEAGEQPSPPSAWAAAQPGPVVSGGSHQSVRPRQKAFAPLSKSKILWGALIIVGAIALPVLGYLGWQYLQLQRPLPTPVAALASSATPRPVNTMQPTWTQTATPQPSPTRTTTPTPTATEIPTLAPPGPTAKAYMIELEGQVMNVRGLNALQEVPRYVTTRSRFMEITTEGEDLDQYYLELRQSEWSYKALGMLAPEFDLVDYDQKVGMVGAAAVYLPSDKAIFVFGLHFSGAEGFFYVHEYGHALVDQHYDLSSLGVYPDCLSDSQRCTAIRSLVEGDATLLMYLWFYEYAEYEEYRDLYFYVPPSSLSPGQKAPPWFGLEYNFPYQQGFDFVYYLYQQGGWSRVNQAYGNLPDSTEQILHPAKYLAGEAPMVIDDPAFDETLGSQWAQISSDSLGEWDTYLLLGYGADPKAQLDDATALSAASGWGGDHYQVYRNLETGQSVLAAHWAWDTQTAAGEFNQALATYLSRRYTGGEQPLGRGKCWAGADQVSCLVTRGSHSLWLMAPDVEIIQKLFNLYPDFR